MLLFNLYFQGQNQPKKEGKQAIKLFKNLPRSACDPAGRGSKKYSLSFSA